MRNYKFILLIIVFIFFLQPLCAQLSKKYDYSQHDYQSLRYGWFKPAHYDKKKLYPLIVYLHGSRDTVSRDNYWYQEAIQQEHPAFVLTPKCDVSDQGWGNTWNAGHSIATAKTLKLIDSLVSIYPIDKNRLYVYGISMGGLVFFQSWQKSKENSLLHTQCVVVQM